MNYIYLDIYVYGEMMFFGTGRVSTGVKEIDIMLHGGLLPGKPYIIAGNPGSGKTTLGLQFLIDGIKRGESVIYVTLFKPPNEIKQNYSKLGSYLNKILIYDAISDIMTYEKVPVKDIASVRAVVPIESISEKIRKSPEFNRVIVSFTSLQSGLKLEMMKKRYDRIVIDSITALRYFCMEGVNPEIGIQSFIRFLSELNATSLILADVPKIDYHNPELMLGRGQIRMHKFYSNSEMKYAIWIEKFKGSEFDPYIHYYRLTSSGIEVDLNSKVIIKEEAVVPPITEKYEGPTIEESALKTAISRNLSGLIEDLKDATEVGIKTDDIMTNMTKAINLFKANMLEDAAKITMECKKVLNYRIYVYNEQSKVEKVEVAEESGGNTVPESDVANVQPREEQPVSQALVSSDNNKISEQSESVNKPEEIKDVANVQPAEEQPVSQALVSSDNNKITEQVGSSIKASGESFVDKGIVSGNESVEKQSKAPKKTRKKKETAPKETKPKKASTKKGKRIKN
ncbi:MAG: RAD55 family ATPase [Thermoplasmata archaeon]